jgi:hypothetical protein
MTDQSETEWKTTAGTLIPPQILTFTSTATVLTGEVFNYPYAGYCNLGAGITGAYITYSSLPISIDFDFSWPALQPPAAAPWTIKFNQPVSNGSGQWTSSGVVSLNSAQSVDTTIPVTWVIQPQAAMLSMGNICPGNTATFNPGTSVLANALTVVKIPAGQTQVTLNPVFEPVGEPYNVQVVAWQGMGNLQSADCITIPSQAP